VTLAPHGTPLATVAQPERERFRQWLGAAISPEYSREIKKLIDLEMSGSVG